jgi:[NiFe] hydrogenase diaphorase moiety large subunit
VVEGYLGKPTVVNNVETFAWVSTIMQKGPEWFHGIGTEQSKGPKLFSVSGDCKNPGVYEFPLGITIKELLAKVGGEDAKAVQVGGASGVCVPAKHFDRSVSFEDAATGGAIIVFGQNRDMRHVAINFMEFFVHESCGQCTPCRLGNSKILDGLKKAREGKLTMGHLQNLMSLSETMKLTSKCGGGQSTTNAFMSIVEHFQNEIIG